MNIKHHRAGIFTKQYGYRSFQPNTIDHEWTVDSPEINSLLEEAIYKLAQLNASSIFIPNSDLFIRMHIVKEATQSSRIEGAKTNIDEALLNADDILPEAKDDWQEVQNYIEVLNYAVKRLKKLPLSSRLIREAHKILLKGVRGKNKMPGEFRTSQNWIGGATLRDATFIPPHHSLVPDCIADLEKFLNNKQLKVPHLIRIGIAHYQFEAIHPFLDGNGRIGRLLITLYLVDNQLLTKPTLYLSDFIEKNREAYYQNLINVSERNQMEQWLRFFLVGIIETATLANNTFSQIIKLREEVEQRKIATLGKRVPNAQKFINFLYNKPIVSLADVTTKLDVTKTTAAALINDFQKLGILKERTGFRRNRIYVFADYLNLFQP